MNNKIFKQLFVNNEVWRNEKISKDKEYFKKLSIDQSPKYLMIGCSDSRVPLSSMFKAEPGEIFIHRNIANQVNITDINFLSVLEYSVDYLHIEDIIVTGHYKCGGVSAAMDDVNHGLIENWVSSIRNLYDSNIKELSLIKDKQNRADRLSEMNTILQVENLLKIPIMQRAFENKKNIKVHALIFNIYKGEFIEMKLPIEKWKECGLLPEHYSEED